MQKVIVGAFLVLVLPFAWSFGKAGYPEPPGQTAPVAALSHRNHAGEYSSEDPLPKEKINWISLPEAEKAFRIEKKTVLIDLYTDWCSWCKVMDKKTYSDPEVIKYINEHFLAVKLDAETREKIIWMGKEYNYQPSSKMNAYAVYLTRGNLSFPTTVFIPQEQPEPMAVPGFLEPRDIESLLKYFGDGHFPKTPFEGYIKKFTGSWK